ncbi:MAG TPA: sulfide/dihydroorotate dehydrogenase-like FAD/NAD-binding protein, partial [Thermoanaerobaculia bacterium]|nr:sulfide/dihydroorotate dehydrogenase-like FAD/NAD-binding protein [Thermoanaerobaculia bacterium]
LRALCGAAATFRGMFRIVRATSLGPGVKQFEIEAPRIARKQQPGQFVIIRIHESGERIPLTIKGSDRARGTITLVVQAVGKTTSLLNELDAGDAILDVAGPLGKPSEIERYGRCVVIGGGVGTAIALPTAAALKAAGNHVTAILGARTRNLLILENEMRLASDELFVRTDDGSYGARGVVTDTLKDLLAAERVDFVLAIGPVPMMRAVAEVTRPLGIRTVVSLNSIMVDGTGMCGGCRVAVGDESKFACVDGPEFDAHQVDFQVLMQRNAMYRQAEQQALSRFNEHRGEEVARVKGACARA